jgi:hypothetical protein
MTDQDFVLIAFLLIIVIMALLFPGGPGHPAAFPFPA